MGNDAASLDEKRANVAIVVTSEICRGTWIAWRGRNYKAFCSAIGQVPQNGVLCVPSQGPATASQHCVAHFVDFGVIREV